MSERPSEQPLVSELSQPVASTDATELREYDPSSVNSPLDRLDTGLGQIRPRVLDVGEVVDSTGICLAAIVRLGSQRTRLPQPAPAI